MLVLIKNIILIVYDIFDSFRLLFASSKKIKIQTVKSLKRLSQRYNENLSLRKKDKIRKKSLKGLEKLESAMHIHREKMNSGKQSLNDEQWMEIQSYWHEIKNNLSKNLAQDHLTEQDKILMSKAIEIIAAREAYKNGQALLSDKKYDQLIEQIKPQFNDLLALLSRANTEYLSNQPIIDDDEYFLLKQSIVLLFHKTHIASSFDLVVMKEKIFKLKEAKAAFKSNHPIITTEEYNLLRQELKTMGNELSTMVEDINSIIEEFGQLIVVATDSYQLAKEILKLLP